MQPASLLSLDQSPPFVAPVRFFLAGPLHALLAGLLLFLAGPELLASRWMPGSLALAHLLALGCLAQIMAGALIQILPVVAGVGLPQAGRQTLALQLSLNLGVLGLAAGFWFHRPALLAGAGSLLAAGLAMLALLGWRGLARNRTPNPTLSGLRLAFAGLLVTLSLGLAMAAGPLFGFPLPRPLATDLHAGWGVAGWSGLLLVAMAYIILPMFQMTPPYPTRFSRWLPFGLCAALLVWSLGAASGSEALVFAGQAALATGGLAFIAVTLSLQERRRRRRAEPLLDYWRLGLFSMAAACLLWLAGQFREDISMAPAYGLALGILLLAGGLLSFVSGMLFKILPFLAWLHLQQAAAPGSVAPPLTGFIPEPAMRRHLALHAGACLLLLAATLWPAALTRPAALVWILASGELTRLLWQAARRYQRLTAGSPQSPL